MSNYDEDEVIQMISDCEEREGKLSDWEREFISSIKDQVELQHRVLSERQVEILNNTWERVT